MQYCVAAHESLLHCLQLLCLSQDVGRSKLLNKPAGHCRAAACNLCDACPRKCQSSEGFSNAAQVTEAHTVVLAAPKGPLVKLDDKHYKLVDKMEALTQAGGSNPQ